MNNVWEDYEVQHQATNEGEATMATKKATVSVHDVETNNAVSLLALVGQLDDYARRQILETFVRTYVTEIARTEFLIDSVEIGEDAVMDLKGERPGPDSVAEGRTLTEAQMDFLVKLHENVAILNDAMALVVEAYESSEGQLPPFGLAQIGGEWKTIAEFSKAKDNEYRRAVQSKLKKAETAKEKNFSAEGAKAIVADRLKKAASKTSRFG